MRFATQAPRGQNYKANRQKELQSSLDWTESLSGTEAGVPMEVDVVYDFWFGYTIFGNG